MKLDPSDYDLGAVIWRYEAIYRGIIEGEDGLDEKIAAEVATTYPDEVRLVREESEGNAAAQD